MQPDNPYAALDTPGGVLSPADRGAAAGSHIRIGDRRAFTGRWIVWTRLAWLAVELSGLAAMLALTYQGVVANEGDHLVRGTVALFAAIAIGLISLRIRFEGLPDLGGRDTRSLAAERSGFSVDLRFEPRLPLRGGEGFDTADDVGVLWLEDDRLHFEGDRGDIRLHRDVVSRVSRERFLVATLIGLGPDTRIDLHDPIGGQRTLFVNVRERWHTPRTRRRARELRRALAAWHAGPHHHDT